MTLLEKSATAALLVVTQKTKPRVDDAFCGLVTLLAASIIKTCPLCGEKVNKSNACKSCESIAELKRIGKMQESQGGRNA